MQQQSPVITEFLAAISPEASPETNRIADIEQCRAYLNKRQDKLGIDKRCELIVKAYDKGSDATISGLARDLQVDVDFVRKWLARFTVGGFADLTDAPRSGRPAKRDEEEVLQSIHIMLAARPNMLVSTDLKLHRKLLGHQKWTVKLLAEVLQLPYTTLLDIIYRHKIDVAPKYSWCISKDPKYEKKLRKCHELYSDSSKIVLCFDEKPCIQALEKEIIRLSKGRVRFGSRYKRHGVIHLFAVLNVRTGRVYYQFRKDKNKAAVKEFLDWVITSHEELQGQELYLILDNLSTHKNLGKEWLDAHPNLHFAFTPTCSSWVNLVESFFGIYTRCCLKDASWESIDELIEVSSRWIDYFNEQGVVFKWGMKSIDHHLNQRSQALSSQEKVVDPTVLANLILNGQKLKTA